MEDRGNMDWEGDRGAGGLQAGGRVRNGGDGVTGPPRTSGGVGKGFFLPPPARRATSEEWLPPPAYLPRDHTPATPMGWTHWESAAGTSHRPRAGRNMGPRAEVATWDAQATLNDLAEELAAERVYASVDALVRRCPAGTVLGSSGFLTVGTC